MTAPPVVTSQEFRAAMARFPSGIAVVTTTDGDGTDHGFTASSFTSVSLDPPLVLVCIARSARCHPVFQQVRRFGVSILASGQGTLAQRFASSLDDKFQDVAVTRTDHRTPLIRGALCTLECETNAQYDSGDHTILVGRVTEAVSGDGSPLVWYDRGFHSLAALSHPLA
ncbi:flavin reductase family protein [Streptomyces sp. NPDC003036]|uniref:flavin reductase family protein n=2 Tax=unclassified Streptomyces TaxID=2593676 RepID=UPI0033BA9971